jgi:DNA gyrase subunit A
MATAAGVVKKVTTSDFQNAKTRGIIAIKLDEAIGSSARSLPGQGRDHADHPSGAGSSHDRGRHPSTRTRIRGVTGIKLSGGDELAGALRVNDDSLMLIMTECGYGKRVDFSEFTPHGRATGGQKIYTISDKTGRDRRADYGYGKGRSRLHHEPGKDAQGKASTISTMGRAAQGVRILNIERPDILIGIDSVANEDEETNRVSENGDGVISIAGELDLDGSDEVVDTGLKEEDDGTGENDENPETDDSEE